MSVRAIRKGEIFPLPWHIRRYLVAISCAAGFARFFTSIASFVCLLILKIFSCGRWWCSRCLPEKSSPGEQKILKRIAFASSSPHMRLPVLTFCGTDQWLRQFARPFKWKLSTQQWKLTAKGCSSHCKIKSFVKPWLAKFIKTWNLSSDQCWTDRRNADPWHSLTEMTGAQDLSAKGLFHFLVLDLSSVTAYPR